MPIPHHPDPQSGTPTPERRAGLVHDAAVCSSDEEYVADVVGFMREGLEADERVSAVTTRHNISLLREALGATAADVEFAEQDHHLTPARKIALLHALHADDGGSARRRSRVVGEALFGATMRQQVDWLRYEAILNAVFARTPLAFLCVYDTRSLPAWVVETAQRTHPHVRAAGNRVASTRYDDPAEFARACSRSLVPQAPRDDDEPDLDICIDSEGLMRARRLLAELARETSESAEHASDITVGLNEIVTNALEHGSDRARVRCWRDTDGLFCEVSDEGPGLDDPLAGYWPPAPDQLDGRGLWLARQTLDMVELTSGPDTGTCAYVAVGG